MQESNGTLSLTELILNASFLVQVVMAFLLVLSLVSWTIIIQRSNQYKLGRQKADEFEDKFWSGIDLNNLYQDCLSRQQSLVGLEVIYAAGFKEFVRLVNSGPADQEVVMDGTYRQMKVATSREVESLESHLPTLATIGSISPYIGLFGTVWGIMHAFVALAAVKNATLSMVAPPIAEALIATAMGLFAAIPAVMFYNRFVTKVEALENRYLNFMDEFSTILNRRLVTIRSQINKGQEQQIVQGQNIVPNNMVVQTQATVRSTSNINQNMQNAQNMQNVQNKVKVNNHQNANIKAQQVQKQMQQMQNLNLQQINQVRATNVRSVKSHSNLEENINQNIQAQVKEQSAYQQKAKNDPYHQDNVKFANNVNVTKMNVENNKKIPKNQIDSKFIGKVSSQNQVEFIETKVHDTNTSFIESDPNNANFVGQDSNNVKYKVSEKKLSAYKNKDQSIYNESPYIAPGGQNQKR